MSCPDIVVTLPPDYLARYVTLRAGKSSIARPRSQQWEIQAASVNVAHYTTAVTIGGEPAPRFPTRRDARAFLAALAAPERIWAEPRERSQGPLLSSLGGAAGWRGVHAQGAV